MGTVDPAGLEELRPPARLEADHDVAGFDSGSASLDDWLRRRALSNEGKGASRTYVVCQGRRVVAFYCLATGSVVQHGAPGRIRRNLPDPIPVMVLGRLAVDRRLAGRGLGRALLRDAVLRTLQAADIAGILAIFVHARDGRAAASYRRNDFIQSPGAPLTLFLPLQDARAALG